VDDGQFSVVVPESKPKHEIEFARIDYIGGLPIGKEIGIGK
jgi:hypothetical protein